MGNDGIFTQILIQEIETLNLRVSQYQLLIIKGETEKFEDNKIPEEIITLTQNLIDEIKISVMQIIRRIRSIAPKLRLTPHALEKFETLATNITHNKIPDTKTLEEFLDESFKIYAGNIIDAKVDTTAQTVKEFTKRV